MARKIIYLINPISGTKKKSTLPELISRKTEEQAIPFEICPTEKSGDYTALAQRVRQEAITDIVICGGDGTVSAVTAALMHLPVQFGILPMGSGNGLARTAGIPSVTGKALQVVFDNHALAIDGFMINERFSCMLCGIGFDAQVAHDFAKAASRGLKTYIKISALNFLKAKPYPFIIESKEKNIRTEAFFISIANSNQFGNNFKIAPRASLRDGLLDIVIVKKMKKFMLPFSIIGQLTGMNALQKLEEAVDKKNIIYFQTASLAIRNPLRAPLHVDGDPAIDAESFTIRVLPKAFRLLQPRGGKHRHE